MPRYHLTIKDRTAGGVTLPACQSMTVGKLDFRRYTSVPSRGHDLPDETYPGAVGEYKPEDVAAFHEAVKHFVVRWGFRDRTKMGVAQAPQLSSAVVHDTRNRDYSRASGDEDLADYLEVREIQVGVPVGVLNTITAEQAAAKQDAEASEARARATDPTDAIRRKVHARAKAAGESLGD